MNIRNGFIFLLLACVCATIAILFMNKSPQPLEAETYLALEKAETYLALEKVLIGAPEVSLYQTGELHPAPGGATLQSSSSGGAFFRFKFDNKARRVITLRGQVKGGSPTLRVTYGDGKGTYSRLWDGSQSLMICEENEVELLIFSGEEFSFYLEFLGAEESSDCVCDDDLKNFLMEAIPGLSDSLISDRLEAARLLLDWAANANDYGHSQIVKKSNQKVNAFSAAQIYYKLYAPDLGGTYCGGAAVFFDKVLKVFEFNSFTVDFGSLEHGLTHVTVVLGLKVKEQLNFYLFDPTFNLTLRQPDGLGHLPMKEFLFGRPEMVRVEARSLDRRDFYAPPNRPETPDFQIKKRYEDYTVGHRPGYGIHEYFKSFQSTFDKGPFTADLAGISGLFRNRVYSVGAARDSSISDAFKNRLSGWGIPVGRP